MSLPRSNEKSEKDGRKKRERNQGSSPNQWSDKFDQIPHWGTLLTVQKGNEDEILISLVFPYGIHNYFYLLFKSFAF